MLWNQVTLRRPEHLLIAAVGTVAIAGLLSFTAADPDLWGHITFGSDILHHGGIPRVDAYSFASDRPWINHEWLAEIVMYSAYAAGGAAGLNALKGIVCIATAAIVIWWLNRQPLPFETRAFLFVLALVGTKAQTGHVRPQLFSVLLFAALIPILKLSSEGKVRTLLMLPPLMALWANLHGGWILGAGTIALWCLCELIRPGNSWYRRVQSALASLAAVLATVVNPYGVGLWRFLVETVRLDRSEITDWQPVRYATDNLIVWLLIAGATLFLLSRTPRRWSSLFLVALVALLAIGSFRVLRLEAFFALAAVLLLAPALADSSRPVVSQKATAKPAPAVAYAISAVAMISIVGAIAVITRNAGCIAIDRTQFPEPEAVRYIRDDHLRGRMVTWFDWGEYAIWHLSPDILVSMDGRRETVYSAEVLEAHLRFYGLRHVADREFPAGQRPDFVWLPKTLPVVSALRSSGWAPLFEGPISILLAPEGTAVQPPQAAVGTGTSDRSCFPGP